MAPITLDIDMCPELRALVAALPVAIAALRQISNQCELCDPAETARIALDNIDKMYGSEPLADTEQPVIRQVKRWLEDADPAVKRLTIECHGPYSDPFDAFRITTERTEDNVLRYPR